MPQPRPVGPVPRPPPTPPPLRFHESYEMHPEIKMRIETMYQCAVGSLRLDAVRLSWIRYIAGANIFELEGLLALRPSGTVANIGGQLASLTGISLSRSYLRPLASRIASSAAKRSASHLDEPPNVCPDIAVIRERVGHVQPKRMPRVPVFADAPASEPVAPEPAESEPASPAEWPADLPRPSELEYLSDPEYSEAPLE